MKLFLLIDINNYGDWGLGIGDWGLGIGDWAPFPIPNPQSPIPNPQSPYTLYIFKRKNILNIQYKIIKKIN